VLRLMLHIQLDCLCGSLSNAILPSVLVQFPIGSGSLRRLIQGFLWHHHQRKYLDV
jgi:hypothetical protein